MDNTLEKQIIEVLTKYQMHISCCESCTGGLIIASLINIPGASKVINESYVTYSNESKVRILGVHEETIKQYQVESLEVAKEMVEGLYKVTNCEVCISVTGFAGSNKQEATDGLCYYGVKVLDKLLVDKVKVNGDRNTARFNQKEHILLKTLELLLELEEKNELSKF